MANTKQLILYELHTVKNSKTHFHYKGPFNNILLKVIGGQIRTILTDNEYVIKKIYRIFIELAQNVSLYSQQRLINTGVGAMQLNEYNTHFEMVSLNIANNERVDEVKSKIEKINSSDTKKLREYKRKQLLMPDSKYGGGNIGLIMVALTSQNPLQFRNYVYNNNNSFLEITAIINK